jgi:hypothetical protein
MPELLLSSIVRCEWAFSWVVILLAMVKAEMIEPVAL